MLFLSEEFESADKFNIVKNIDQVKYYFHDREPEVFHCIVPEPADDFESFLDTVKKNVTGFEFKLENEEGWKKINSALESLNLVYVCNEGWKSNMEGGKFEELSPGKTDF